MKLNKLVFTSIIIIAGLAVLVTACSKKDRLRPDESVIGTQTVCPVMGNSFTITKHTPVVECNGETYYFCCAGCDKDFLKDPEKYTGHIHGHGPVAAEPDEIEIGQKAVCPVSGDTFVVKENSAAADYRGTRYFFCCPGCKSDFMKNPDRFLDTGSEPDSSGSSDAPDGELLYWTCSMHPEVRSETEGNCPLCGMALTPLYASSGSANTLYLDDAAMELAGIDMIPASTHIMYKEIHVAGKVAYDPELVIAQEEYLTALDMNSALAAADEAVLERAGTVLEKARYKLRLLGMDKTEIRLLEKTHKVTTSLIIPEEETWIYADVFEQDMNWIEKGQSVVVTSQAIPGKVFHGTIRSISPILTTTTHTVRVRIRLSGENTMLKPGAYVMVDIKAPYKTTAGSRIIAVPKSAVINTGTRTVVWVYKGEGMFEPRAVKTGPRGIVNSNGYTVESYPILDGLQEGDLVVTAGNFLVDSESQITGVAAIGYSGAMEIDEATSGQTRQ